LEKKQLIIDPRGGMSGDMFSAALISAGADFDLVRGGMVKAASRLGKVKIERRKTADDSTGLIIDLEANDHHLEATVAQTILAELFAELKIDEYYRTFGSCILETLLQAEEEAHSKHDFFKDQPHSDHHNGHHKTYLHEAQDIVIDIMGAIIAMQHLNISSYAVISSPVSVGEGMVEFSHGRLPIPAPATRIVLDKHQIPWRFGPIQAELCTPTGASILAALQPDLKKDILNDLPAGWVVGRARVSKDLDIPPLMVYII